MNKVNVLMATYNGEQFLQEQIDSILRQRDVSIELLARDDGSTDGTVAILSDYQDRNALHYLSDSKRLGPALAFLRLLKLSSEQADYYAFSDQDDWWEEDKLSVAVSRLKEYGEQPALYFCRTQLADRNLHPLPSPPLSPLLTFGESLIYEFIPGCTMVMNRRLRDIINAYTPHYLPMHDVWIYSVALSVGAQIEYDDTPHILYRQHGNNTIGQGYSRWHEWKRRWERFRSSEHSRSRRAQEILTGYSRMMPAENASLLQSFLEGKTSLTKRLRLALDKRLRCANPTTQRLFWLNLLTNSY